MDYVSVGKESHLSSDFLSSGIEWGASESMGTFGDNWRLSHPAHSEGVSSAAPKDADPEANLQLFQEGLKVGWFLREWLGYR